VALASRFLLELVSLAAFGYWGWSVTPGRHLHTSALAHETTRALLDRSIRRAGGTELRGLAERLQITA
jgi:hypothetical protein